MAATLRRRLAEADFWDRHENPASGWSRVPTGALLVYALSAAVRRKPGPAAVCTALSMALKLAFVNEMAKLYDRETGREAAAEEPE